MWRHLLERALKRCRRCIQLIVNLSRIGVLQGHLMPLGVNSGAATPWPLAISQATHAQHWHIGDPALCIG